MTCGESRQLVCAGPELGRTEWLPLAFIDPANADGREALTAPQGQYLDLLSSAGKRLLFAELTEHWALGLDGERDL